MIINSLPPVDDLFDRFYVDSSSPSGLRWARSRYKCRYKTGDVAGSLNTGQYWRVTIDDIAYPAHRVVQVMKTGVDRTDLTVDHINRNMQDNHPFNLRWATMSMQAKNKKCRNKTGYRGVLHHAKRNLKKPFQAQVWVEGRMKNLGMFETALEAHQAWLKATS